MAEVKKIVEFCNDCPFSKPEIVQIGFLEREKVFYWFCTKLNNELIKQDAGHSERVKAPEKCPLKTTNEVVS